MNQNEYIIHVPNNKVQLNKIDLSLFKEEINHFKFQSILLTTFSRATVISFTEKQEKCS